MPAEAEDDFMTGELFQRRIEDRWRQDLHVVQREVDVIKQRTDALEIRTDRMMTESAESRAESREIMGKIFDIVRELQEHRAREEGRREGKGWADTVQRWAVPAVISVIALSKTMGWI